MAKKLKAVTNNGTESPTNGEHFVAVPQESLLADAQQTQESSTDEEAPRKKRKSILARMRESQSYEEDLHVQTARVAITYRKPSELDWFRVHPDSAYKTAAFLVSLRQDRRPYVIVGDALQDTLRRRKQGRDVVLYTCLDRYGNILLWGIPTGPNDYNVTAHRCFLRAQESWVRMYSNTTTQVYRWDESDKIPPPLWPNLSFEDMIEDYFGDNVIETPTHQIVRELLGEV
jgi:hypothetical protein